jgi:hypothetical protein
LRRSRSNMVPTGAASPPCSQLRPLNNPQGGWG